MWLQRDGRVLVAEERTSQVSLCISSLSIVNWAIYHQKNGYDKAFVQLVSSACIRVSLKSKGSMQISIYSTAFQPRLQLLELK